MSILLNLIPPQYRIAAGIIAALVVIVGAVAGGWTVRGWKADADIGEINLRIEKERADALEEAKKITEGWDAAAQIITAGREADRQQAAADRREWQKERDHARTTGPLVLCGKDIRNDGAARQDRADPRLAGAAVRLWNDALDVGLPAALRTGRTDGAGQGADLPGAVTFDDALDNHAANAEQCNDLRGQVMAWQAWARSIGATK